MRPGTIKAYAFGVFTGSAMTAALTIWAAPAKADVSAGTIDAYATAVCETLDMYPSTGGVTGVAQFLMFDQGYTSDDAASIVVQSVIGYCPHHVPVLKRFIALYGDDTGVVA